MADSNRLAEVCAMLVERDEEFRPIEEAAIAHDDRSDEPYWSLSFLGDVLQVKSARKLMNAVNRAKVAAGKAGMSIAEHFREQELFDRKGQILLSKYAAYLVVMNCDPDQGKIGLAQVYFALQVDRQHLEDEKRLRTRLDVAAEAKKLNGVAKDRGVNDFRRFNGVGIQGLYGGLNAAQVKTRKGLPTKVNHLDYAGSEELAANLFRITQTRAALHRQESRSENRACSTHLTVAERVRSVITDAGNTPPEALPAAELKIDRLATKKKRELRGRVS